MLRYEVYLRIKAKERELGVCSRLNERNFTVKQWTNDICATLLHTKKSCDDYANFVWGTFTMNEQITRSAVCC